MFIMQNNESRLIKAARRTIRAEVTLVVVVIVISSWSIYALYKLATSSDLLSGIINFSKSSRANTTDSARLASEAGENEPPAGDQHIGYYRAGSNSQQQALNYSQPESAAQYRARLLRELMTGQQELYANLGAAFQNPLTTSGAYHERQSPLIRPSILSDDLDLVPAPRHLKHHHQQQLRQKLLEFGAAQSRERSARPRPSPPYLAAEKSHAVGPVHVAVPPSHQPEERQQVPAETADREAAESNNDSGESIIDSSQHSDNQQSSNDENESTGDGSSSAQSDEPEASDEGSQEGQDASGEQSEQQSGNEEEPSSRESSSSIDDEVDRISQPSLNHAQQVSQHSAGPEDYVKNTVQFDDFLSNGAGSLAVTKSVPAGSQIARFEEPRDGTGGGPAAAQKDRAAQDLQVDHNSPIGGSTIKVKSTTTDEQVNYPAEDTETLAGGKSAQKKKKLKKVISGTSTHEPDATSKTKITDTKQVSGYKNVHDTTKNDQSSRMINREKRSPALQPTSRQLKAPYELKPQLTSISKRRHPRRRRVVVRRRIPRARGGWDPLSLSESAITSGGAQKPPDTRQVVSERRSGSKDETNKKERAMFSIADGRYPMPSYLTTNDSVLQELLDRRRLIDALNDSQLPAPYIIGDSGTDPKTAGSLNHIDHGLMLFPAADEHHEKKAIKKSASATKKKGKHLQMKAKRKMSSGSKKGGHKGKKLDKEEKKFLKEKKFKGAKKGKKVSKGKGGAGGKKGKKLYKDKGYKKKGFKNVYHKEEWANKKSFFDEYRDKDFKKKWKKFDDKYNYAQMKKFQAKDEKGAKKLKHHDQDYKNYHKGKWRKNYHKQTNEHKELMKKKKKKTHEHE